MVPYHSLHCKFHVCTIPIHFYSNHRLRYWRVFLHCSTELMNHPHFSIMYGCGPAMAPINIRFGNRHILIENALHSFIGMIGNIGFILYYTQVISGALLRGVYAHCSFHNILSCSLILSIFCPLLLFNLFFLLLFRVILY